MALLGGYANLPHSKMIKMQSRILIVDERAINREWLIALLNPMGYRVAEAADGAEALGLVCACPPDLIIIDVQMPGMDGFEFCQRLMADATLARIPILFYTAAFHLYQIQKLATQHGHAFVLAKPSDPQVILATVTQLLGAKAATGLASAAPPDSRKATSSLEQGNNLRIASLLELSLALAAERHSDNLLKLACRGAVNILGMPYVALALLDQTGCLRHLESSGLSDEVRTALGSRPTDARFLSVFHPPVDRVLCEAIQTSSHHYGWLYVAGTPDVPALTVASAQLATHLAAQVAQAWENLRQQQLIVDRERHLSSMIESVRDAIITIDDAQNIQLFNPAAEAMFGHQAAAVLGQPLTMLLPPGFRDGHTKHIRSFGATGVATRRMGGLGVVTGLRANGEEFPIEASISQLDTNGDKFFTVILRDITQRKAAEEEIKQLAFYDPLTHLPNRRLMLDRLRQALVANTRSQQSGALFFIDLDNFKLLNDTLGHEQGDLLLQQVAQRLLASVREGDTVARLGGDEFVVMLEGLSPQRGEAANQAKTVGETILAAMRQNYQLRGHDYHGTPSIGISVFSAQHESLDELLKQADMAMYQAKAAGRNTLLFFDLQTQAAVNARARLEAELREGVREGQFVLHYQAQVMDRDRITGAEALVRWQHPQRGLVFPNDFIYLAEETGLILPLGQWVLETACAQLAAWAEQEDTAHLTLAVNISVKQLKQPDFEAQVMSVLARTGADPYQLKLELTETLLMNNVQDNIAKMTALKNKGVYFALDDFGTGFSSLAYLKLLPIEKLKIDRSFVMDVLTDPNNAAIAKTIVTLAQSLGIGVIAEGVETQGQKYFLAQHGCHAYQGYLFSRPLPLPAFEALVRRPDSSQITADWLAKH